MLSSSFRDKTTETYKLMNLSEVPQSKAEPVSEFMRFHSGILAIGTVARPSAGGEDWGVLTEGDLWVEGWAGTDVNKN